MPPLISIIVPVYNTEGYLRQCVESVLAQTYSDWELILVDDGSTDASGRMCDLAARSEARIKVIHKSNGGLSSARNKGIGMARGEYITFLDSDDIIHPLFLELMSRQALATKAAIVACKMKDFSDDLRLYSSISVKAPFGKYTDRLQSFVYPPRKAAALSLYQKKINSSACGKLFKASLWRDERFRENTGYEDLDLIPLILLKSHATASFPMALYFYRQHGESYVHRFSMRRTDVLRVTERMVRFMEENHPVLLPAALDRQLSANFNILGLLEANKESIGGEDRAEALATIQGCWEKIKELRWRSLVNANVRMKNKAGVLASYLGGKRLVTLLSKMTYRS